MSEIISKTKEEIAELLQRIPADEPLGTELFEAVARLTPTIAFEAVALRRGENGVEVFMTQRGPDEAYPNQWHVPGSIFRNGEDRQDVVARLMKQEFETAISRYQQVYSWWHQEERGWQLGLIHIVVIPKAKEAKGTWWPVEELPENIVDHHRDPIIPLSVEFAQKHKEWFTG